MASHTEEGVARGAGGGRTVDQEDQMAVGDDGSGSGGGRAGGGWDAPESRSSCFYACAREAAARHGVSAYRLSCTMRALGLITRGAVVRRRGFAPIYDYVPNGKYVLYSLSGLQTRKKKGRGKVSSSVAYVFSLFFLVPMPLVLDCYDVGGEEEVDRLISRLLTRLEASVAGSLISEVVAQFALRQATYEGCSDLEARARPLTEVREAVPGASTRLDTVAVCSPRPDGSCSRAAQWCSFTVTSDLVDSESYAVIEKEEVRLGEGGGILSVESVRNYMTELGAGTTFFSLVAPLLRLNCARWRR